MIKYFKIYEVWHNERQIPDGYYYKTVSTLELKSPDVWQLCWEFETCELAENAIQDHGSTSVNYSIQTFYHV